jgi:hypothetical protein
MLSDDGGDHWRLGARQFGGADKFSNENQVRQ